jgi:hypothetical protein
MTPTLLNPRVRSLARGNVIVLSSLCIATLMSQAPHLRPMPLLLLPAIGCLVGMADTLRCMQKRWSFYHGGVLLCLYMDLMAVTMVLFYLIYPYLVWVGEAK